MFNRTMMAEVLKTKLKSFRSDIDHIKVAVGDDELQVDEAQVANLIEEVEDKYNVVEGRFLDLSRADDRTWLQIKDLVDNAWAEATLTIDRIRLQLMLH